MLAVAAAQAEILKYARPRQPILTPVSPSALGLVVAEDIFADRDLPPFPKSMMDGFAVRTADCANAHANLDVVDEIMAGTLPTKAIGAGHSARIMTGAALPDGADAVVVVEDCRVDGGRVTIQTTATPGQNVQPVGREMRRGETVITTGTVLGPAHFAVLATVGRTSISVYSPPTVSIIATGNELVEPNETPGPGQIRNSNATMLMAQCVQVGTAPQYLGIARDDREHLRAILSKGLVADVLILSGGVSAGTLDLVPDILKELDVQPRFHKVAMKPGKPLFFGTKGDTLIFGLPGNPVSSFVGFELFVRPAILNMRSVKLPIATFVKLPLSEPMQHKSDRPTYHPARIDSIDGNESVRLVAWHGSPDLKGLCAANALALLQPGSQSYPAGTLVPVLHLPG